MVDRYPHGAAPKGGPRPPRRAEPRHRGHRHAWESRDATEPPGALAAAAAAASGAGTRHLGTWGPWRLKKFGKLTFGKSWEKLQTMKKTRVLHGSAWKNMQESTVSI